MARLQAFATGRRARFICDGCGLSRPYSEAQTERETGFRKCRQCGVDEPDPGFTPLGSDPVALRFPRPERRELAGLVELDTGEPLVLGGSNGFLEIGSG